ncbi:MAG: hypothetical protein JRJ59_11880 [Deltaproteobacteria bacterium]|nr:hypothetical protein [Deltaproteobacteria bacterium]
MIRPIARLTVVTLALVLAAGSPALAETVRLPITVDYQLLRSMFIYQVYTAPGQRAVALDQNEGCTKIELWQPELAPEGPYLRLGSRIKLRAGVPVLDQCLQPVDWEGYIEVVQRLWLDEKNWVLRFETIDSRLYKPDRTRTKVGKVLWDLVKTHLHDYLNQTRVNLGPPVEELRQLLPLLFPPQDRVRVGKWLDSVRPGPLRVGPQAVELDILMDVERPPEAGLQEAERRLSPEELDRFIKLWETWDAFLLHEIRTLSEEPLTEEEKLTILETILESRYRFVRELSADQPGRDLVRQQFVTAWQRLAPIFRKHLGQKPSPSLYSYLAFFSASDALAALDKLGPTLGLDISRNGLIRLARLLNAEGETTVLTYGFEVDPKLRKMLGLGPALDESGPAFEEKDLEVEDLEEPAPEKLPNFLLNWLFHPAWAAKPTSKTKIADLRKWLVTTENVETYLPRVRSLLTEEAERVLDQGQIAPERNDFFHRLILATAWQESCFRQFKIRRGKLVYLRSYNRTSVGLLQVNERVWRKLFNRNSLRWNIRYNARAGCQIMDLYLRRYALRQMDPDDPLDDDLLARTCYAMYNGGPSQFKKFLERHEKTKYYQSDLLFWEKYFWTKFEQWDKIHDCLF